MLMCYEATGLQQVQGLKEFEKRIAKLCGTNKAVALGSATACLESILRFLGIGAGDEVITSAYTYTASASPAVHVRCDT